MTIVFHMGLKRPKLFGSYGSDIQYMDHTFVANREATRVKPRRGCFLLQHESETHITSTTPFATIAIEPSLSTWRLENVSRRGESDIILGGINEVYRPYCNKNIFR